MEAKMEKSLIAQLLPKNKNQFWYLDRTLDDQLMRVRRVIYEPAIELSSTISLTPKLKIEIVRADGNHQLLIFTDTEKLDDTLTVENQDGLMVIVAT